MRANSVGFIMKNIFRSFARARLLAVFLLTPSLLLPAIAEVIEIDPVEVTATRMSGSYLMPYRLFQ